MVLSAVNVYDSRVSAPLAAVLENCLPPLRAHPAYVVLRALAAVTAAARDGSGAGPALPASVSPLRRLVRDLTVIFDVPPGAGGDVDCLRFLLELLYPQGASAFGHLTLGEAYDVTVAGEGDDEVVGELPPASAGDLGSGVAGLRAALRRGAVAGPPNMVRSLLQLQQHPYFAPPAGAAATTDVQRDYAAWAYPLLHKLAVLPSL